MEDRTPDAPPSGWRTPGWRIGTREGKGFVMHPKKLSIVVCALACLLVWGCGKADASGERGDHPANAEAVAVAPESRPVQSVSTAGGALGEIVTPEVLGTNLKYVESLIGRPAMRTMTDALGIERNFYKRGDCYIQVGAKDARVVSVGADNLGSEGCDVDVGSLLTGRGHIMASQTKYADYSVRGPLHFTDGQIPGCNACGEGMPYALIDGYSAIGNFDVQLSGDGDYNTGSKWRDIIRDSGVDDTKLPLTKENCPLRAFDAQGFELMKGLKVTGIAFGVPNALQPVCSGEVIHDQIMRQF